MTGEHVLYWKILFRNRKFPSLSFLVQVLGTPFSHICHISPSLSFTYAFFQSFSFSLSFSLSLSLTHYPSIPHIDSRKTMIRRRRSTLRANAISNPNFGPATGSSASVLWAGTSGVAKDLYEKNDEFAKRFEETLRSPSADLLSFLLSLVEDRFEEKMKEQESESARKIGALSDCLSEKAEENIQLYEQKVGCGNGSR